MSEPDDDFLPPEILRFAPWRWTAWTWRDWIGLAFLLGVSFLLTWMVVSDWWFQDDF